MWTNEKALDNTESKTNKPESNIWTFFESFREKNKENIYNSSGNLCANIQFLSYIEIDIRVLFQNISKGI